MTFLSRIKSGVSSPGFRRIELGVLCILLAFLFARRINYVQFFTDESFWIAYSSYFDVLVTGDVSADTWSDVKRLTDQPLLPVYTMGLSRYLAGYHAPDLNTTWNYRADYQTNLAEGRLPSAGLLWWSRFPMAVLAAVTGVALFWTTGQVLNRLAGYLWLLQYVASYYITATLCRAMAESCLLAMVSLAGVCGVFAMRGCQKAAATKPVSIRAFRSSLFWFSLFGVCCGLATSSKINGATIVGAGLLLIVWSALKYGGTLSRLKRLLSVVIAGSALSLSAIATFIVLHPILYYDTLDHASLFLTSRLNTMGSQQQRFAKDQIDSLSERVQVVPDMILRELAVTQFTGSFWLNLAVIGFGMAVALWQVWRRPAGDPDGSATFMLLAVALLACTPPLFTPLNWPRYYVLPVVFTMIFAALGLAQAIEVASTYVRRLTVRVSPQPVSMD